MTSTVFVPGGAVAVIVVSLVTEKPVAGADPKCAVAPVKPLPVTMTEVPPQQARSLG